MLNLRYGTSGKVLKFRGELRHATKLLLLYEQGIAIEDYTSCAISEKIGAPIKLVRQLNKELNARSLLVERFQSQEEPLRDQLYNRQIRFLSSFESDLRSGADISADLQNKKVVIVGLGAYGTWLLLHSVRLGIKNIVAIDFDIVERSNLHRQVIYGSCDIGRLKTSAAAEIVNAADPSIEFHGIEKKIEHPRELNDIVRDADLVFNAFGYMPSESALSEVQGHVAVACTEVQTPMLCLSTNWIGPLYIPRESACYFCAVRDGRVSPSLKTSPQNRRTSKRAFGPLIAANCSIAIWHAAQYLSGIAVPESARGIVAVDPFELAATRLIPISRSPSCPYCSD